MYKETVNLWKDVPGYCQETPILDIFIPTEKKYDIAVIILPGGGYRMRAEHEGKDYAEFLSANGICSFVCQYRVSPHRFPLPLLDATRAIKYVRYYSEKFGIDKDKIYIMGSSAGGHLAALASVYRGNLDLDKPDVIDAENAIPNGQILCYPVIKLLGKKYAHLGSGQNLLDNNHAIMGEELSPDLIADKDTPKAFIWHTFEDQSVNVINSLDYAKKLREMNVEVEMHIYPKGPHGIGLANDYPHTANWSEMLLKWIEFNEGDTNLL